MEFIEINQDTIIKPDIQARALVVHYFFMSETGPPEKFSQI